MLFRSQLADMAKFYESVGGYEQVKSRLSNPQKYAQPEPTKSQEPAKSEDQETQPQTQSQTQPQEQAPLPKGYASWQELMMACILRIWRAIQNTLTSLSKLRMGTLLKK